MLSKAAERQTSPEFVAFLADIVANYSRGKGNRVIADNLSAPKTRAVAAFLVDRPKIQMHFTPNEENV